MIAFGPVPSRRLGRSLGINNVPPKHCTYSCVYCQLGRTVTLQTKRLSYYPPDEVLRAVQDKINEVRQQKERIDYLTFVPDGEPTLDANLGEEITLLRPLVSRIAVITNASLIGDPEVQAELRKADWVSLKVDAVEETIWRRINRPHRRLRLERILEGMRAFAKTYHGHLVTETMLASGLNDDEKSLQAMADFLGQLAPATAYLAIPTRPPAEDWVRSPAKGVINRAYHIAKERVDRVECLIGYEGDAFACTGSVEDDLLAITAVHPLREEAVRLLLKRAGADWSVVIRLLEEGRLVATEYKGRTFYIRPLLQDYPSG